MFGRVSGSCGEIEKSGRISSEIQGMRMRFYENFGAWGWVFFCKRPWGQILEAGGADFGGQGARFWRPGGQILEARGSDFGGQGPICSDFCGEMAKPNLASPFGKIDVAMPNLASPFRF